MRVAASILLVAALGGCAVPYEPASFTGVYNDVDQSGYTSHDTAKQEALLRAADRTLAAGFTRFVIGPGTQSSIAASTPLVATQARTTVSLSGQATGLAGQAAGLAGQAAGRAAAGDLVIRMVRVGDPEFFGAFDAKLIEKQLRNTADRTRASRCADGPDRRLRC